MAAPQGFRIRWGQVLAHLTEVAGGSERPTEEDAKALLAQYPRHCQCWRTSDYSRKNGVDVCRKCEKPTELRFVISSVQARAVQRDLDLRNEESQWPDRLDGIPLLKISPLKRKNPYA